MDFRLVVAGVRYFDDYSLLSEEIDKYICTHLGNKTLIIVSGCADGTDKLGERYASEHNLTVERYPAEWEKYGKAAESPYVSESFGGYSYTKSGGYEADGGVNNWVTAFKTRLAQWRKL
jgi:hypothetical protein